MFNPLDNRKALALNPFHDGSYNPPVYIKPGLKVAVEIDSREMEVAILAAYDYGLDALNEDGREVLNRLIAELKDKITGQGNYRGIL
ncbi:hypothetical protein DBV60_001007 [Salmonella enterica subsp. enterica serovar Okatie]|uniref:hypothetical protein n=1 Tax=Salmonella enterica TaxID=28901 RepID=UPI0009AC5092|nr:hypothetical protein [Salmonella enterica]EAA1043672.1 hypothetical protein [Salmonella enterica subsp. enterica serovar Westeinde]EBH9636499.1 hypothetical protein [Salmonella enterica subsp. enterica serovar Okatie]ECU7659125.1 hypothetical protein [Salmonella enterica subsp. enterica serovar Bassadji]EDT6046314.1 hypothetical protein [Salmonella enterica subsp. enterica serovar Newyork]EAA5869970.1 hypothetical protein [Salmonella enterica]